MGLLYRIKTGLVGIDLNKLTTCDGGEQTRSCCQIFFSHLTSR
jgi:hypothetical protein